MYIYTITSCISYLVVDCWTVCLFTCCEGIDGTPDDSLVIWTDDDCWVAYE